MGLKLRKIVIIGAGHVGTMCGLSLMYRGEVDDLVYIDIDREKAYSQALDLDDAVSLLPHQITVRTGDYGDVEDADVIVMAAGVSRLPGQTRLDMLDDSIRIMKEVASHMQGLHIQSGRHRGGLSEKTAGPSEKPLFQHRNFSGFVQVKKNSFPEDAPGPQFYPGLCHGRTR